MHFISKLIYGLRVKRAIKKANWLAHETKYRYYVLVFDGKPAIYRKKDLKLMIARGYFKGLKVEDLERIALHKTY